MKARMVFVTFMLVSVALLVSVSGATWCDSDYAKRINVSVNNTGGGALTDYQVYVNLSDNPINETSLRVYNATSCTLRSHWSENTTAGNSYGIWINYSQVAGFGWSNNTAIYYNNPSALSTSDGDSTFMFYTDFLVSNLSSSEVPLGTLKKAPGNPIFAANTSLTHEAGDHFVDLDIERLDSGAYMYYSSSYSDTTYRCINYATTTDNVTWTRGAHNPVLTYSGSGWESQRVTYMSAINDTAASGKHFMIYTGTPGWDLGLANSTQRDTGWTKYSGNPVLDSSSETWHSSRVLCPVLWKEGSTYYMLFAGSTSDMRYHIGLATSTNMVDWTEYSGNPVMTYGAVDTYDDYKLIPEDIVKIDGTYYLSYGGNDGTNYRVCLATSTDLHTWTRYAGNPVISLGSTGAWDAYFVGDHSQIEEINGKWWIYYTGVNVGDSAAKIGVSFMQTAPAIDNFPLIDNCVRSVSNDFMTITGDGLTATGTSSWSTYIVEVKTRMNNNRGMAIYFGVSNTTAGSQNYSRFIWKGNTTDAFQLHKRVAGTWSQVGSNVASAPLDDTWYWLKAVLNGSDVKCYSSTDHETWTQRYSTIITENPTGEIALGGWTDSDSSFDDAIVRKYAATEPLAVLGSEENATESTIVISNVVNGSISSTAQYVDWDVNQTAHNRVLYSNESDLTPAWYSTWDNTTAVPNITLSSLTASTQYWYQAWSYNTTNTSLSDNSSTLSFITAAGATPTLHIDNSVNIKDDWGRDFNSNLSANVTVANASGVWMNFTNAEFTNTSLGDLNLTLDEWVNVSHNVNTPVSNISVEVTLNSTTSGATNDSDSFWYEITNRTNTATMDSAATQNVDTSETFYVNATCNEEYGDTFLGAANLLEDGAIIDTDSSVTNHVNFSHSESSTGVYNYTIRFYNLTHHDNATTPTYSNVTVSSLAEDYLPGDPTTLQNSTGNYWVNYTWNAGSGNVTDSYNVSWNLTWFNNTLTTYMQKEVGASNWGNITVWAYNATGNGSLSAGSISDETQADGGTYTTPMGTTAYNLITYYGSTTSTAEQFGIDIGSVDYIAMYNSSFYTHTMGFSANNFTTYHGIGYYVYLNASGSSTYLRNNIPDVPYNTQLFNRWNTIGWTNSTNTNAEGIASSIGSACKYTSMLNADGITYTTHTVGFTSNNHAVDKGKGYWVWVNTGLSWSRNS